MKESRGFYMTKIIKNSSIVALAAFALIGLGGCSQQVTPQEAKEKYQSTPPGSMFSEVFRYSATETTTSSTGESSTTTVHVNTQGGRRYAYYLDETVEDGVTTSEEILAYEVSETDDKGRIYNKVDGEVTSEETNMAAIYLLVGQAISGISEIMCEDYSSVFDVPESYNAQCSISMNGEVSIITTYSDENGSYSDEMRFSPQSMLTYHKSETTSAAGITTTMVGEYTMNANFETKTSL